MNAVGIYVIESGCVLEVFNRNRGFYVELFSIDFSDILWVSVALKSTLRFIKVVHTNLAIEVVSVYSPCVRTKMIRVLLCPGLEMVLPVYEQLVCFSRI